MRDRKTPLLFFLHGICKKGEREREREREKNSGEHNSELWINGWFSWWVVCTCECTTASLKRESPQERFLDKVQGGARRAERDILESPRDTSRIKYISLLNANLLSIPELALLCANVS